MPWRWTVGGLLLGYALANTRYLDTFIEFSRTLPYVHKTTGLYTVTLSLLGLYILFLVIPLTCLAGLERRRYNTYYTEDAENSVRSSFRRNLRKRGSIGHLEFLGFEVETRKELVLTED